MRRLWAITNAYKFRPDLEKMTFLNKSLSLTPNYLRNKRIKIYKKEATDHISDVVQIYENLAWFKFENLYLIYIWVYRRIYNYYSESSCNSIIAKESK